MKKNSDSKDSKGVKLKFYADVFAWFPNGQVKRISPGDGIYYQACIHPEGTDVVFSGNSSGTPRVWKGNLNTNELIPLTSPEFGARHPAFSWDGQKIVFSSDRASGQNPERIEDMESGGVPPEDLTVNLFVMDSNGNGIKQITKGSYQDQRPCFSPDGKQIAFVSNRSGSNYQLWVVDSTGTTNPIPLHVKGYRPWYSVDGQWIYFFSEIKGRHQICKTPSTGGTVIPLANDDSGQSRGPFADPHGKTLLMHSTRGGNWGIWELPLDLTPPSPLKSPGFDRVGHPTRSKSGIITFDVVRFDPNSKIDKWHSFVKMNG